MFYFKNKNPIMLNPKVVWMADIILIMSKTVMIFIAISIFKECLYGFAGPRAGKMV